MIIITIHSQITFKINFINYKLYPREEGEGVLASVVYTVIIINRFYCYYLVNNVYH